MNRMAPLVVVLAALLATACGDLGVPPWQSPPATPTTDTAPTTTPPTTPHEDRITMSATPTAEEALGVMRSLVARQDPSSPPPATPTPLLRRGLQPGPPGVLLAPDLALMVTRDAVGLFSVQDAKVHCDILSLAGFSDWRLPSIIELDQLTTSPRLPANRGQVRALWSSSIHDISGNLLLVLPQRSIVHQSAGSAHVVCVRSMVD